MPDQIITLERFIASNVRTVRATRTYLLNKPCTRCHHSTNLRVDLPTCSHRICSACLTKLKRSCVVAIPVACPTCSTYWFTLLPKIIKSNVDSLTNSRSVPGVDNRSKDSECHIHGDANFEESTPMYSIHNMSQAGNSTTSNGASHTPSLVESKSPRTSDVDSIGSAELESQISCVQGQWKAFCAGQDEAVAKVQSQALRNGRSQRGSFLEAEHLFHPREDFKEGYVFELEDTESRASSSRETEMQSPKQSQPPIIANGVVTDAPQDEQQSCVATLADEQLIIPAQSLAVLLFAVCIVFEIVSNLV